VQCTDISFFVHSLHWSQQSYTVLYIVQCCPRTGEGLSCGGQKPLQFLPSYFIHALRLSINTIIKVYRSKQPGVASGTEQTTSSVSLPLMWSPRQYWSYYKTGLRPAKFCHGLGLVSYDLGVWKFQVAFRWQLRTTQCRTPTNITLCLAHTPIHTSDGDLQQCSRQV